MPYSRNPDDPSASLRRLEGGAISNPRVERYALMRAEEVLTPHKCWVITHSSRAGNLPGGKRQKNVNSSAVFKARLEELMQEKTELEAGGTWGRMEWQARQAYRVAVAKDDLRLMMLATDQLYKIVNQGAKPPKVEAENDDDGVKRPRGAPSIAVPDPADHVENYRVGKLLDK